MVKLQNNNNKEVLTKKVNISLFMYLNWSIALVFLLNIVSKPLCCIKKI